MSFSRSVKAVTRGLAIAGVAAAVGAGVTVPAHADEELPLYNVGVSRCVDGNQQGALYMSGCWAGDPGQRIVLRTHNQGAWELKHRLSGRCLTNLVDNTMVVELRPCTGGTDQQWRRPQGGGDGFKLKNERTGRVLDSNGVSVYALESVNSTHQLWHFEP